MHLLAYGDYCVIALLFWSAWKGYKSGFSGILVWLIGIAALFVGVYWRPIPFSFMPWWGWIINLFLFYYFLGYLARLSSRLLGKTVVGLSNRFLGLIVLLGTRLIMLTFLMNVVTRVPNGNLFLVKFFRHTSPFFLALGNWGLR